MLIIPGPIVSLLTFPGVIVHEAAHRFFCDVAKVPVYAVRYFRFGNPAGYVQHGEVPNLKASFLISVGPLIVNTILCALFTFPIAFPLRMLGVEKGMGLFVVVAWVGYSIGMHAFPSNEDMKHFSASVHAEKGRGLLFVFAKLFEWLMKLAHLLSFFWFDLIYAVLISFILPALFLRYF